MTLVCSVLPTPMSDYAFGAKPIVVAHYTDPETGEPNNPPSVVVKVRKPDGTSTTYTDVSTPAVTNPVVGTFELIVPAVDQAGDWWYLFDDNAGGDAESRFHVVGSAFTAASAPAAGRWISFTELATDTRVSDVQLPPEITLDHCCEAATDLLSRWSGQQYGVSTTTVGWGSGPGDSTHLRLAPNATSILSVVVDGVVLPASAYHLYDGSLLVRQDGRVWPCRGPLSSALDLPGTWSIESTHGPLPPRIGLMACRELAIWIAQSFTNKASRVPNRATSVSRGGITVQISRARMEDGTYSTGIPIVDDFLNAVNPYGLRRRSRVASPDLVRGAREQVPQCVRRAEVTSAHPTHEEDHQVAQTSKTDSDEAEAAVIAAAQKAKADEVAKAKKAKSDVLEVKAEQNAMIGGTFLPWGTTRELPDSAELRAALGAGVLSLVGDDAADE